MITTCQPNQQPSLSSQHIYVYVCLPNLHRAQKAPSADGGRPRVLQSPHLQKKIPKNRPGGLSPSPQTTPPAVVKPSGRGLEREGRASAQSGAIGSQSDVTDETDGAILLSTTSVELLASLCLEKGQNEKTQLLQRSVPHIQL